MTNRTRLDRIESRYSATIPPRVVLISTLENGNPANASFQGEGLNPWPGETLEQFESRAGSNFQADHVVTIVAGKFDE